MHPDPEPRKPISAERLRELLSYDPETGIFKWLVDRGGNRCAGRQAGTAGSRGELMIRIDYRIYKAHRLAWLYMTGSWPDRLVDHANRNPGDNKWANLRQATEGQNVWNAIAPPNATGFRGVKRSAKGAARPYQAYIRQGGQRIHLGSFATAEEAHVAYCKAAHQFREAFAFTGSRGE